MTGYEPCAAEIACRELAKQRLAQLKEEKEKRDRQAVREVNVRIALVPVRVIVRIVRVVACVFIFIEIPRSFYGVVQIVQCVRDIIAGGGDLNALAVAMLTACASVFCFIAARLLKRLWRFLNRHSA